MSDRSTARFGGQNGESFRGFFYPGQPLEAEPDEALARRLVSWRLRANDQVDLKLLQTDGFLGRVAEIEQNLVGRLLNYGGPWYHALDRFYLEERMQRWVGAGSSNRFIDRTSLYPFFDEDVVAAALSLDGFDKKDSAAAYNMLVDIDLDLAKIALDNGIVPSAAWTDEVRRSSDWRGKEKRWLKRSRGGCWGGSAPPWGRTIWFDGGTIYDCSNSCPMKS